MADRFNLSVVLLLIIATVLVGGCTRTRSERGVEPDWRDLTPAQLAVGETTKSDASAQGAALQFFLAVSGVVDDDYLSESPATHDWGFALLESELPVALNRAQRLDDGGAGVQQQGSPTTVGQHTMEMK